MSVAPLPYSPRETVRTLGLHARKSLGQHFLLDGNLTDRIARTAGDSLCTGCVIEVGPGPGGLTKSLLEAGARQVVAIERDARFLEALQALAEVADGRLTLHHADALTLRRPACCPPDTACQIIANLPYNVGTPLLLHWMEEIWAAHEAGAVLPYRQLILLFQKEVAGRLMAAPGSKAYGRLSVITQWLATVERCFDIPASAFSPPPKVTSTLVRLIPRERPVMFGQVSKPMLERVTQAAFTQRRKMLRASLKGLFPDVEASCAAAGIASTARAETLSVEDFCRLAVQLP